MFRCIVDTAFSRFFASNCCCRSLLSTKAVFTSRTANYHAFTTGLRFIFIADVKFTWVSFSLILLHLYSACQPRSGQYLRVLKRCKHSTIFLCARSLSSFDGARSFSEFYYQIVAACHPVRHHNTYYIRLSLPPWHEISFADDLATPTYGALLEKFSYL